MEAIKRLKVSSSTPFFNNADLAKMYSALPQCENIVLGGSSEPLYSGLLSELNVFNDKVILLQAPEIKRYYEPLFSRVRISMGDIMSKRTDSGKKYAQVAAADATLPVLPLIRKLSSPPKSPTPAIPQRLVEPELGLPLHRPN